MQLNLPILDHVAESKNILIAGAGGGHDILAGLPVYFALREQDKTVHLANFSFSEFAFVDLVSNPEKLLDDRLWGARPPQRRMIPYFPEGFLAEWFREARGEDVIVWMFRKSGAAPLAEAYAKLVAHLDIDAIILVDGGVDSIMRGNESGPGTLIEDTISLAAASTLKNVPVKLLACLGFGTEVEERVCHYHALENIAALAKAGGFLGSCALTPQMDAFQQFEAACRYLWDERDHPRSHITTRVIPAVHGEFGRFHMYPQDPLLRGADVLISPLMSLCWFFDAHTVIAHNLLVNQLLHTRTVTEAIHLYKFIIESIPLRPRKLLPY